MATKNNPGSYDCYANAEPDEPMFVLLGRDRAAPQAVLKWAEARVQMGKNKPDDPQIIEAYQCAGAMALYSSDREAQKQKDAGDWKQVFELDFGELAEPLEGTLSEIMTKAVGVSVMGHRFVRAPDDTWVCEHCGNVPAEGEPSMSDPPCESHASSGSRDIEGEP